MEYWVSTGASSVRILRRFVGEYSGEFGGGSGVESDISFVGLGSISRHCLGFVCPRVCWGNWVVSVRLSSDCAQDISLTYVCGIYVKGWVIGMMRLEDAWGNAGGSGYSWGDWMVGTV